MTKYIILGHENPDLDSIISGYLLEKLLKKQGHSVEFIIPDKKISKENIDMCNKIGFKIEQFQKPLPNNQYAKYILIDHHERKTPNEIVAIIDHHSTNKNISCKYYKNIKSSSTALLIVVGNEKYFNKNDIYLAIFATMADTVAFHSNKTLEKDIIWCKKQCQRHNFNYQELLTASISITDISNIKEGALNGLKKYELSGKKIASSFLHLASPTNEQKKINEMINYIKTYIIENNYFLFAFIIHDIKNFKTTLYKIYKDRIDTIIYEEYTSRSVKIMPDIFKELT